MIGKLNRSATSMRSWFWVIVALGFMQSPTAARADDQQKFDAYNAMIAGFDCAMLGAHAGTDNVAAGDVDRLVEYATKRGRELIPAVMATLSSSEAISANGPLGRYISRRGEEFWLGVYFQQSVERMNDLVHSQYPSDAISDFDALMQLRSNAADLEFRRRNCGLVGPGE